MSGRKNTKKMQFKCSNPANQSIHKNMKTGDVFLRIFRRTVAGFVSGCGRWFWFEKRLQQTYTVPSTVYRRPFWHCTTADKTVDVKFVENRHRFFLLCTSPSPCQQFWKNYIWLFYFTYITYYTYIYIYIYTHT